MRRRRLFALVIGVLMCCGVATADVVTVRHTLDHTANASGKAYYFCQPEIILDHSPFFRHAWEDWGWTHDLTGLVPGDANDIQSATLSIFAWDVDDLTGGTNIILVNDTQIGTLEGPSNGRPIPPLPAEIYEVEGQPVGAFTEWSVTEFNLPSNILRELLRDSKIDVFLNIDRYLSGDRVNIASSTLEVSYAVPTPVVQEPNVAEPNVVVYRFWSPVLSGHFYTISEAERDNLIANYATVWTYEGIAYRAFGAPLDPNLRPIYRFWSPTLSGHFYTISDVERQYLIDTWSHVWTYEGVAWYAYPEGLQPAEAKPVYRFWSGTLSRHFYTISDEEKQNLIDTWSHVWTYEGIAWYACEQAELKVESPPIQ